MAANSIKSLSDMMSVTLHNYMGGPEDRIQQLVQVAFERATDKEDKNGHHFAKLLFERVIPQRKQVEAVGDVDSRMNGITINVTTDKPEKTIIEGTVDD